MDSTHGRISSGVACYHRLWAAHTVERRQLWHASIALWQHTQSKEIGRGMTSPPLDSTHGRTTSGVAFNHAFGQHTRSNDIGRGTSSPTLDSTHGRTTSGVTCHHRLWTAHTVGRCRTWQDITSLGQHTRSNDVGRVMTSPPLESTHGRQCRVWHDITALDSTHGRQRRAWYAITALGQHTRSDDVGRGMTSPPLDCTHGRMTLGVA